MITPTFSQLFITKGLMRLNPNCTSDVVLSSLEEAHKAKDMLTSLAETNILDFMKKKYNYDNVNVTSLLFNKLIATCPNEYNLIVSFEKNCIGINNNGDNNNNHGHDNMYNHSKTIRNNNYLFFVYVILFCCVTNICFFKG